MTLPFDMNGGHAYLCLNHKSQGDNTAAFGSSSTPPTVWGGLSKLRLKAFTLGEMA
jgi:hypothetical protein